MTPPHNIDFSFFFLGRKRKKSRLFEYFVELPPVFVNDSSTVWRGNQAVKPLSGKKKNRVHWSHVSKIVFFPDIIDAVATTPDQMQVHNVTLDGFLDVLLDNFVPNGEAFDVLLYGFGNLLGTFSQVRAVGNNVNWAANYNTAGTVKLQS